MEWLAIDAVESRNLGRRLAAHSMVGDELRGDLAGLVAKVGLCASALRMLDDLGDRLRELAADLVRAAATVESHVLRVAPRPELALSAAGQLASHNTYRSDHSVDELHAAGVRAFEFDLHGPTGEGEWAVFHHAFDDRTNVDTLAEALANVQALPADSLVTVFLDLKDAPSTRRDHASFDRTIREVFGERLFTPLDLIMRSPGASTVGDAVAVGGWPTFEEMATKVLVVVTGDVDPYRAKAGLTAAAFVSARPTPSAIADPHIVVYNAPSTDLSAVNVVALQQQGGLVRLWGQPTEAGSYSNYLALDV